MAYSQTGPTFYCPGFTMSGQPRFTDQSNILVQPSGKFIVIDETDDPYRQPLTYGSGEFGHTVVFDGDRNYFRVIK